MRSKGDAHEAVSLLFQQCGVPPVMITDCSKEQQVSSKFRRKCQEAQCRLKGLEPYTPQSNAAEKAIGESKKGTRRMLMASRAPKKLWDHAIELHCLLTSPFKIKMTYRVEVNFIGGWRCLLIRQRISCAALLLLAVLLSPPQSYALEPQRSLQSTPIKYRTTQYLKGDDAYSNWWSWRVMSHRYHLPMLLVEEEHHPLSLKPSVEDWLSCSWQLHPSTICSNWQCSYP